MLKLSFSFEIVLSLVWSGIRIVAPRYDTDIIIKSIMIQYNFNESFRLYKLYIIRRTKQN